MIPHRNIPQNPASDQVVTKAFRKASTILNLNQKEIADILGPSESTISRIFGGNQMISVESKEGEIALLFLRMFRSLDSLFGGDENNMKLWLDSENHYLHGVPRDLIKNIGGLLHVIEYLDAMRGKV